MEGVTCQRHAGLKIHYRFADGDKHTDYVSVSNTIIGAILLATGLVGALAPLIGPGGMLLLLALFGFTGVILDIRLPEA